MRRREFFSLFNCAAGGAVLGCIVGSVASPKVSVDGQPGWASQKFGVSAATGQEIEKHTTRVAALGGGLVGGISNFVVAFISLCNKSKTDVTEASPAEGGHRPLQGPSPAAL